MGCTSAMQATNAIPQDVDIGGTVNFGTIVRRYGKNINLVGGNVVTNGIGYYEHNMTVDFTGAAGDTILQAYENGVAIPGARVVRTTGAGTVYSITMPTFLTRNKCCNEKTITLEISGAAVTDLTANVASVKI